MDMKKYIDIARLKNSVANQFDVGEPIVLTEKVDGANAQIRVDVETGEIACYSRRQRLTPDNGLNGFYNFVQTLDADMLKAALGTRYILFGEWLVKHSIKYPDSCYNKFYAFDVYDTETELWCSYDKFLEIVNQIDGIFKVPVFYNGTFKSWTDVLSYVGCTQLCAEPCGEGVVVKRQSVLSMKNSRNPYTVKIVAEKFSEVHKSKPKKPIDPAKLAEQERQIAIVETVVTERRVEKMILKLVDEGIIPADWGNGEMKLLAKTMPKEIYADCVKEEPETVAQVENFGKIAAQITMKYVRALLDKQ